MLRNDSNQRYNYFDLSLISLLICISVLGSHTAENISENVQEVLQLFSLNPRTATSDQGRNYVNAIKDHVSIMQIVSVCL
jgi:hypothetical protein